MESQRFGWRWGVAWLGLGLGALWGIYLMAQPVDEVVLTMGEPYEQVRQHSRSTLPKASSGIFWGGYVVRPARMRFIDPQYGFVTAQAKFLFVGVDEHGKVDSVSLSPQVETLSLNNAMALVVDLQDQFRRGGWKPFRAERSRPIEDTPTMRAEIRKCSAPTSYWQASNKYQVSLNIRCFRSDDRPNDERYLITLDLGPPVFDDYPDN